VEQRVDAGGGNVGIMREISGRVEPG